MDDNIRWYQPSTHRVWDSLPNVDPPLNPGDATDLYALRNTVEYLPLEKLVIY